MRRPLSDLDAAVAILAAAFQDEPVTAWIFPDAARRRQLLPSFFRAVTEHLLDAGEVYLSDEAGVVLLVPPAAPAPDPDSERRYQQRLRSDIGEYAERALCVADVLGHHHPRDRNHYYVVFMGVRPERQNSGTCGGIMRSLLARADGEGSGTYIECSTPRSMALMARLGFTARPPVALPAGPVLYPAWREPGSTSLTTGAGP